MTVPLLPTCFLKIHIKDVKNISSSSLSLGILVLVGAGFQCHQLHPSFNGNGLKSTKAMLKGLASNVRSFQTGSKKTWVEKRLERKNCKKGLSPVCARLTARKSKDLWHDITHCSDHGYPATTINSEWFTQSENGQNTVGEAVNKPCTVDFNSFVCAYFEKCWTCTSRTLYMGWKSCNNSMK